jgi:hypothetical protein
MSTHLEPHIRELTTALVQLGHERGQLASPADDFCLERPRVGCWLPFDQGHAS